MAAGRPWHDTRAVANGVLWVLRTAAPWHDLPGHYPPSQTCYRRFQHWKRTGILRRLLRRLGEDQQALVITGYPLDEAGVLVGVLFFWKPSMKNRSQAGRPR